MNAATFIAQAIDHFTIPAPESYFVREPLLRQIVTPSSPKGGCMNAVTHFGYPADERESGIAQALEPYRREGLTCWWIVPAGEEALETRLRELGFRLDHDAYGLSLATDRGLAVPAPGISVEEMSEANLDDYISVSFGAIEMLPRIEKVRRYFREAVRREVGRLRFYLARHEGRPAGTGLLHLLDGFGNLGSGFVAEPFRKLGVYRALVAHRLGVLRQERVTVGVVLSKQETSAPILLRLGFRIETEFRVYERVFAPAES